MPVTVTWTDFQNLFKAAITALNSGDTLGARKYCVQAKMNAIAMGADVQAAGTTQKLLVQEIDSLLPLIKELEIQTNMRDRRLIKFGAQDSDFRGRCGGSDGVEHDS